MLALTRQRRQFATLARFVYPPAERFAKSTSFLNS
jgi:hypothetical protein